MIVRTITVFDEITVNNYKEKIKKAAKFLSKKESFLIENGDTLQTKRIASSLFDSVIKELHPKDYIEFFSEVNDCCKSNGISLFNPGTLDLEQHHKIIEQLDKILSISEVFNVSLRVGRSLNDVDMQKCMEAAKVFKRLVETDYQTTFRFSINANCQELIPFYPVSYYKGKEPRYALGLQLATEVNKLINVTLPFDEIFVDLFKKLDEDLLEFEERLADNNDPYEYFGIDTSFAPMVGKEDSIGDAYERILKDKIGSLGTLSVTAKFTHIMKNLNVMKTGYCGIMLAILEDSILAQRFSEGSLTLEKLMLYSTVCACGLDTIPVSSLVDESQVARLYYDINTLAYRHNKPLTVRLMSIPDSKPGDMTTFDSPYICNTKLFI